jgi:hypothetical protein
MLQKTKNKETLSILKRLKQKGPPVPKEQGSVSMDMTVPNTDADLMEQPELGMPDASGIVTDLSMPGALPIGAPRPIKKKKQETPRSR